MGGNQEVGQVDLCRRPRQERKQSISYLVNKSGKLYFSLKDLAVVAMNLFPWGITISVFIFRQARYLEVEESSVWSTTRRGKRSIILRNLPTSADLACQKTYECLSKYFTVQISNKITLILV